MDSSLVLCECTAWMCRAVDNCVEPAEVDKTGSFQKSAFLGRVAQSGAALTIVVTVAVVFRGDR